MSIYEFLTLIFSMVGPRTGFLVGLNWCKRIYLQKLEKQLYYVYEKTWNIFFPNNCYIFGFIFTSFSNYSLLFPLQGNYSNGQLFVKIGSFRQKWPHQLGMSLSFIEQHWIIPLKYKLKHKPQQIFGHVPGWTNLT